MRGDFIRVANPEAAKIEFIEFVAIEQLHNSNQQGTSTVPHTGRLDERLSRVVTRLIHLDTGLDWRFPHKADIVANTKQVACLYCSVLALVGGVGPSKLGPYVNYVG